MTTFLWLDGCCGKQISKTILTKIIMLINIGILYYFGIQIYNYSYSISYHGTNSLLHLNYQFLSIAIVELFKLSSLLVGICFWVALYEPLIETLECAH